MSKTSAIMVEIQSTGDPLLSVVYILVIPSEA